MKWSQEVEYVLGKNEKGQDLKRKQGCPVKFITGWGNSFFPELRKFENEIHECPSEILSAGIFMY